MAGEVTDERILYLYGIVRRGGMLPQHASVALEGIPCGQLVALVEWVPAAELSGDALTANLEQPEWLARRVQQHAAVLELALAQGPVVPARFCTLFSSPAAVVGSLTKSGPQFLQVLERISGCKEWGLKVFGDESALRKTVEATDPEASRLEAAAAAASPGQAYLLTRKREEHVARLAGEWMDEVADRVVDLLEPVVVDVRLKPLQENPLTESATGPATTMCLNLALLVADADLQTFQQKVNEAAEQCGAEGFQFQVSGPWPAYSFCGDAAAERWEGDGGSSARSE